MSSVALAGAHLVTQEAQAQSRRAQWISTATSSSPAVAQAFAGLARAVVGSAYDLREPPADQAPTAAETIGGKLRNVSAQDLIFVGIDQPTLTALLRRDSRLLSALGLEPMNIGVSAAPFYLFARTEVADAMRQQSGVPRRIVYVDKIGTLQPADVAGLLDPLLRTKAVVVGPLDSPRELARRLVAGNADIVGIYDDDPSTFRSDFLAAYEELRPKGAAARLQALKLVVFPASDPDYRDGSFGLAQNDLTYAIVRYDDVAFNDAAAIVPADRADRVVALSKKSAPGPTSGGLLLLTNLKQRVRDDEYQRIRRLISHAHLAALFRADLAPVRCVEGSRAAYRAFLFNAHQADKTDVVKSLAVWSDLMLALTSAKKLEQAQIKDQVRLVEEMLAERQSFRVESAVDWENLAVRLSKGATLRQQFSDQHSTLFRKALENVRGALTSTGPVRRSALQEARATLIELIRKRVRPACTVGGSEGLYNMKEFDPFFYLGLIEAHLAMETA